MLNERKKELLNVIMREHIKSAQPVGSTLLVDKYNFNLSPATIRNEMADLEREEYIYQPHISAGRVPTQKAYKLYVNLFLKKRKIKIDNDFLEILEEKDINFALKQIAKMICNLSGETVFLAFRKNDVYYTGISNLFSKPEFSSYDIILNISEVIDAFDEILSDIFKNLDELNNSLVNSKDVKVLIGSDNPFSPHCASILMEYNIKDSHSGILGILGPMRMDYEKNVAVMKEMSRILSI